MPCHGPWRGIYNNGKYEFLNERQLGQKMNEKIVITYTLTLAPNKKDMQEEFDT